MPTIISNALELILSATPPPGSVEIEEWSLGIDCRAGDYVLNLYAGGLNYPEIVAKEAVAGIVQTLGLAKQSGAKVYYWPTSPVLLIGRIGT